MAYVIAEIGFNHEGNLPAAAQMIRAAARAGADAVKFQTFQARDLALPSAAHFEAIKSGQMTLAQHQTLAEEARNLGIEFLSTPYSPEAVALLEKVGVQAYKVASMDCTNRHLLAPIAATRKPIYLSTGMATLAEMATTLEFLRQRGSGPVTLLHCLSLYPAAAEDLNLAIIPLLKEIFGLPVGYSDHFPGSQACLAAVMLGAEVIETHFTLDTTRAGGDHHHSLDPDMLTELVKNIGLFQKMRGQAAAIHRRPDRGLAKDYRRGVYAAEDLAAGKAIAEEDILFCRPTSQLSPSDWDWLKGARLSQNVAAFEEIKRAFLD